MAFQDSFSAILAQSGVMVDPASVADRATVLADIDALAVWLDGLEADTRLAIDEVTASNAVQGLLADPEVAVVAAIGPVLEAFDAQPSSISVSAATEMMAAAANAAED